VNIQTLCDSQFFLPTGNVIAVLMKITNCKQYERQNNRIMIRKETRISNFEDVSPSCK
jgi:hypothetical protein